MKQYNNIQQLMKKEDGQNRKPIYTPTHIQAVFDGKTGASLEAILAQFNSIYVQYQGTPKDTRLIIPKEMRRAGLTITYMDMDSNTITERANSAVQKDNDHWALDVNWSRIDELSLSGDIAVSANGTWVINGSDTGVKALGPKGDAGLTPWLKTIDNRLHYSYDNETWEPCSDYIAAYFRWNDNKIQISRDNKTWTDLSGKFADNLHIKGYVATYANLPSGAAQGDIYGVGPTYAESDTAHTNPIYRYYVRNANSWVDNGTFTSIQAGIVQETGDSETAVMSQKAVSTKLSELGSEIGVFSDTISIDDDNSGFLKIGKTFNAGEKIIVKLHGVEPAIKVYIVLTYNNASVQSLGNLTKMGDFITATCESQINGLYFSASENINAQLYVANYGANQKIENVDEVAKEVYNDNKLQDIAIGALQGWDFMSKYAGQLGSTSINKTDISNSYYKILKVSGNDVVTIKANNDGASLIAILKSIDFADLSKLDFASGYDGRTQIKAATSSKFTMPNDANYIIIACLWGAQDRTPSDIKINGKSIVYKKEYITRSAIYLGTEKHHILQSIEWGNGTISSDGSETDYETFIKTDFIDVSGVDLLRIDINQEEELFTTIGLYDKKKQFIKRLNTRVSAQYQFNGNLKENADAHYVKISSNTTDISRLTISVDVLPSRYYNRRLLSNKNIKSFSHAGSSLMNAVTAGSNLPSSMWGTYLNGFDVIHCNVRYTEDNVAYCLHDETFIDEVSGNTIVLGDVSSAVIDACKVKGQPLAKVESVVYLAKMMGLDVCLYNVYGKLDSSVIADIVRMAKTYGMFEHIYFGIPNSEEGLHYLDAIYAEYPKAKILLTQASIPTIEYSQITEVVQRANNVLSTRPELEVYLWINSGYDTASYERLNTEKPYKVKVGCYQVTKEQEPIVLPYVDIYTSANGLRSFGIARRDMEVAVTNKYPEFLMGDYGNIV